VTNWWIAAESGYSRRGVAGPGPRERPGTAAKLRYGCEYRKQRDSGTPGRSRVSWTAAGVQYWGWRVVSAAVGRLPVRAGYGIATVAGWVAYYGWPRGRRSMQANYAAVMPGASRGEIRRTARGSLVNYCRYLADFVRLPRVGVDELRGLVDGNGQFELLDAELARGHGAVIVCMHFGNWDMGAGAAAARGLPLTVVAESFGDARLDKLVVGARERLGMQVVKMERAGPSLLRALKGNGLLALLIDQPRGGDGVRVQFFGHEIEVPAGPARMALRTGAKVIPAAFARVRPWRPEVMTLCDFGVALPDTGDRERDVRELTQRIVAAHEGFIRERPEQWYMFRPMFVRRAAANPS